MEYLHSGKTTERWPGALIVARDALIFLIGILAVTLAYLLSPNTFYAAAAAASTVTPNAYIESLSAADADSLQTDASLSPAAVLATPDPSESAATPEITPQTPQDAAAATGDFSAVFPATDTGEGAYLSFQSDSVRIAITKNQKDGVTYFVADVWVKTIDAFHTALADGTYGRGIHEMPLKTANDNHAVFAVSGDYYGARDQGVVVRNGILYRDVMGDDVCILKKDGTLTVYQKGSFSSLEMLDSSVWQAWAFGPALVENGAACDTSASKIKVENPRCAIGYYEPGHYCFIVVDGRQSGYSDGMTLDELVNTFVSLGCVTAYNLDGGATAMMVFQGAVVNQPTGGGRSSSDIIYF